MTGRRVKTYSGESGYVYQYVFLGKIGDAFPLLGKGLPKGSIRIQV